MGQYRTEWPNLLEEYLSSPSDTILNLGFSYVPFSCMLQFSYYQRYFFALFTPLFVALLICTIRLVSYYYHHYKYRIVLRRLWAQLRGDKLLSEEFIDYDTAILRSFEVNNPPSVDEEEVRKKLREMHQNCLSDGFKPREGVKELTPYPARFHLTETQARWDFPIENYKPTIHNDPSIPTANVQVGSSYEIQPSLNRTLKNPRGRTGMIGRGCLFNMGANQAIDVIITRFRGREFQMIVLQRNDGWIPASSNPSADATVGSAERPKRVWAIPGRIKRTSLWTADALATFEGKVVRLDVLKTDPKLHQQFQNLFRNEGKRVGYRGYVDDPRNTDDAWVETEIFLFQCSEGTSLYLFSLSLCLSRLLTFTG
jgi:hypothetical protein